MMIKSLAIATIAFFMVFNLNASPELDAVEIGLKSERAINLEDEAARLSALGSVYHQKGDYTSAVDYYTKSIQLREKIGVNNTESYANLLFLDSIALHKLGNSCSALNTIQEAVYIYNQIGLSKKSFTAKTEANEVYLPACKEQSLVSKN